MYLKLFKAFPKYAIVVAVLVISTGMFVAWWVLRSSKPVQPSSDGLQVQVEDPAKNKREEIARKAASLPARMGWLALVGSDLYDISTGELIFSNWIGGAPQRLFYQRETNRLMAQTDRGVIRFALDGSADGQLGDVASPPAFTHDGKMAMFVRSGDVWIADVDWQNFRFVRERQATRAGNFNAPFFAANVMLGSDQAIVVRNQGQLVKISLVSGEVQPVRIPLSELSKRRSPDGRFLVGDEPRNIYAYDAEAADAYNFPTKADRLVDYLWIDNNRCAFIVGGKGIGIYDRVKNGIEEVTALPFPCRKIVGPSPSGTRAFCFGPRGILIVDFTAKQIVPFGIPAQDVNWIDDDTMILSRDVPDSSTRGTWIKPVSGDERRILEDPYATGRGDVAALAVMREVNLMLLATRTSLYRMKTDGSELREVTKLRNPETRIQAVEIWGQ